MSRQAADAGKTEGFLRSSRLPAIDFFVEFGSEHRDKGNIAP